MLTMLLYASSEMENKGFKSFHAQQFQKTKYLQINLSKIM